MKIGYLKLLASVILCQAAGLVGSVFTFPSIPTWYATLVKPWFTPPNWVFGPAWTTLFLLMGISLYLVWQKGLAKNKAAISLFGAQLGLNVLWSVLFFGLQSPFLAFAEIIVLWIFILLTIIKFYKIDRKAAYMLVPYIAWVTFAASLNYFVWMLN